MLQKREVQEEEERGSRSNFMVELSLSQPPEIGEQFTIIQSINLSWATGTHCPWCCDEALCMPDETTQGNNSFSKQNKGMERKRWSRKEETKERRGRLAEEEKKKETCLKEDKEWCVGKPFVRDGRLGHASGWGMAGRLRCSPWSILNGFSDEE